MISYEGVWPLLINLRALKATEVSAFYGRDQHAVSETNLFVYIRTSRNLEQTSKLDTASHPLPRTGTLSDTTQAAKTA